MAWMFVHAAYNMFLKFILKFVYSATMWQAFPLLLKDNIDFFPCKDHVDYLPFQKTLLIISPYKDNVALCCTILTKMK